MQEVQTAAPAGTQFNAAKLTSILLAVGLARHLKPVRLEATRDTGTFETPFSAAWLVFEMVGALSGLSHLLHTSCGRV